MKRTLLQRTTYYKTPFDEMSRIDKPETEKQASKLVGSRGTVGRNGSDCLWTEFLFWEDEKWSKTDCGDSRTILLIQKTIELYT